MNKVLCVGLFRRDCEDFAGGGRGDGRHPGCAIGCTTSCLFAQVAADLGRLDSLILAERRQMNKTEYSASYSTYSPRTFTYG